MNRQKRAVVLGGEGFIGSHLVDVLLANGYYVRSFDRPNITTSFEKKHAHFLNSNFELYEGDFLNEADINSAFEGCDICFHLISTTNPKSSNDNPIFDVESNILGTVRLLTCAAKSSIKKIIFASSGGTVYGAPTQVPIPESHVTNPVCSYGISKLAIEKYLDLFYQLYGLEYAVLRVANPYGERQQTDKGQGAVAVFLSKVLHGEEIEIWGDGSVIRDYLHVDDVAKALVAVTEYSGTEHIFNVGSGNGLSLNEILKSIEDVTCRSARRRYVNARKYDVPSNVLCIKKSQRELGWSPVVDFEMGLTRFYNWLKENQVSPNNRSSNFQ